jgi:hypothetical protein
MRRFPLLVLTLALFLAACGDDGSTQDGDETFDPPETTEVPDLPENTVVFGPDDEATDLYGDEVTWTPDADDIATVDQLVADHIEAEGGLGLDPVDAYARQYVGTGDEGDIVSVNALCSYDDLDWEDELILVNDGGTCFWQAQVSLTANEVQLLQVNGSA